jgi:hypothetical protein
MSAGLFSPLSRWSGMSDASRTPESLGYRRGRQNVGLPVESGPRAVEADEVSIAAERLPGDLG